MGGAADRSAENSTAKDRRAHLIGIGGAGMKALAVVLRETGWRVTGSDMAADGATRASATRKRVTKCPGYY
jgi:UDP-N-acetylmuramate-alanine ligase